MCEKMIHTKWCSCDLSSSRFWKKSLVCQIFLTMCSTCFGFWKRSLWFAKYLPTICSTCFGSLLFLQSLIDLFYSLLWIVGVVVITVITYMDIEIRCTKHSVVCTKYMYVLHGSVPVNNKSLFTQSDYKQLLSKL